MHTLLNIPNLLRIMPQAVELTRKKLKTVTAAKRLY